MLHEGQHAEMHYHVYKMEDIINRGGGNVLIRVYNSTEDGKWQIQMSLYIAMDVFIQ